MKLTEHFTLEEFEFSSTARAQGIDNHCPKSLIPNLRVLCKEVLEPLRTFANSIVDGNTSPQGGREGVPILISSGYRCPALNKAVDGSSTSQHMTGEACDIYLSDQTKLREWFTWLKDNVNFDQLILERASKTSSHYWIHVSCRSDPSKNRHLVLYLLRNP